MSGEQAGGGVVRTSGRDGGDLPLRSGECYALASGQLGVSGIRGLLGFARAEAIRPHANTNVLHPRTVIPTLQARLPAGEHWLVSAVYGRPTSGTSVDGKAAAAAGMEGRSGEAVGGLSDGHVAAHSLEITAEEIRFATSSGRMIVLPRGEGKRE
ncbi:hypothetical protein COLU111180_01120 [Cohnella lubricantis]